MEIDNDEELGVMTGMVKHVVAREHQSFKKDCIKCNGTGVYISVECSACGGCGKIERNPFNYGFITPDNAALDDVFVHHRDIEPWREGFKELSQDDVVKFDLFKTAKGLQARNVKVRRGQESIEDFKAGTEKGFGNVN